MLGFYFFYFILTGFWLALMHIADLYSMLNPLGQATHLRSFIHQIRKADRCYGRALKMWSKSFSPNAVKWNICLFILGCAVSPEHFSWIPWPPKNISQQGLDLIIFWETCIRSKIRWALESLTCLWAALPVLVSSQRLQNWILHSAATRKFASEKLAMLL